MTSSTKRITHNTRLVLVFALVAALLNTADAQAARPDGKGKPAGPNSETTLFFQYGPYNGGVNSQNYESTLDGHDDEAADDFTVPNGKTWEITKINADGFYASEATWLSYTAQGTLNPDVTFNVNFYADAGGVPGEIMTSAKNIPAEPGGKMTLPSPVVVATGTYWVSVQANVDYLPYGRWYWNDAGWGYPGNPAKWRQPGGGFGTSCSDWCDASGGTIIGANLAFSLIGFAR